VKLCVADYVLCGCGISILDVKGQLGSSSRKANEAVCEAGGKYTLARITVPSLTLTLAALLPSISVCNVKRTVLIVPV
jgi:hypothetical protein